MAVPQVTANPGLNPLAVDPATGVSLPTASTDVVAPVDPSQEEPSILNQSPASDYSAQSAFAGDPAPTTPFGSDQAIAPQGAEAPQQDNANAPTLDPVEVDSNVAPVQPQPSSLAQQRMASESLDTSPSNGGDLLDIKQQALSQLGPLVSKLDQDPEEKFRTTMMLIQSTDNSALLKDAYDAARAIPDEKARAQALLDVVNEINYFTQQQQSSGTDLQSSTTM